MPYCPKCGTEVSENDIKCPNCGYNLYSESSGTSSDVNAVEHLTRAFNISMAQPMVFVPALLGGIISSALGWLAVELGYVASDSGFFEGFAIFAAIFGLIGVFFIYILSFATIDMGRDAYLNKPLSLGESIGYVLSRIVEFFIASIVGAILAITIILIPVVSLMFVIMVIDESGVGYSLRKSFNVIMADLGDVVLVILFSIIGSAIISYVPFIDGLLQAGLNVVINLAFIDIYYNYRR